MLEMIENVQKCQKWAKIIENAENDRKCWKRAEMIENTVIELENIKNCRFG